MNCLEMLMLVATKTLFFIHILSISCQSFLIVKDRIHNLFQLVRLTMDECVVLLFAADF